MKTQPAVSVVITTYNRSDALLLVLQGLALQSDLDFEVIVADDGSRLEHQEKIKESKWAKGLKVLYVWHPDVGFTASKIRNRGVAGASGNYLIFLDGDCVPDRDFLARHKQLAQRGTFVNGSRVMLSPVLTRQVITDGVGLSDRSAFFWILQRMKGHASKLSQLLRLPDGSYRLVPNFSWRGIRSCNMGVWRSDFENVDGFDESFVGWGHEDADFVLRLHHLGIARKNGYCATEVFHLWHKEASRDQESQNAQTVRQRMGTGITKATLGSSQKRLNDDVVLTRLG